MPKSQHAHDLIKVAESLISAGRPKQAHLKRSISTLYYALFHCLAENCANFLVGKRTGTNAWLQTYRALHHGFAKNACDSQNKKQREILEKFPEEIQDFALQFYNMQLSRHEADYNPASRFTKSEVLTAISITSAAINGYERTSKQDRKAFSALFLFHRSRNNNN